MRSVTFTAIEGIPLINQGDNLGAVDLLGDGRRTAWSRRAAISWSCARR